MTAIFRNFATITHQSHDLLSQVEYRTIVEMIQGILSGYQFKKLDGSLKRLFKHLNDFSDPHLDRNISFYNEIVERTYAIYINMLSNPLSLEDFKAQVAPTLGFVELFRRIVLNRYLYDQVKTNTGSVPTNASVYLSSDWEASEEYVNPINIGFSSGINNEVDFIRSGWSGNTSPIPVIFTAEFLSVTKADLPVVFESSAESPNNRISSSGDPQPAIIPVGSNDFTVEIDYSGIPSSSTNILSLRNDVDRLEVVIGIDKRIALFLNQKKLLESDAPSSNGKATIVVDSQGYLSLQTNQQTTLRKKETRFVFKDDAPLVKALVNAPYQNLFNKSPGLRNITIYRGYATKIPLPTIAVPPGYALLVDINGSFLCDLDGTPLIDFDLNIDGDFEDFIFLVDRDGSYLTDRDGNYLVSFSFTIPKGYRLVVDDEGNYLKDDDGSFIIELNSDNLPFGYYFVIDNDGKYVLDADGYYLTDTRLKPLEPGYRYLVDSNGKVLTDSRGTYLIGR